jgi:ElaB/YqjD/DUF883 family membrane-anchored ribosome-binding protein
MDNEADHIRQQMNETRAALTEKLETLENQVIGTVQEATTAVSETVASVKDAVQDTVGTVKESVQETVHTVKETLSLQRQVERHPWAMVAGSVAVGFLGGMLLRERRAQRPQVRERRTPPRLYQSEEARNAAPEERAEQAGWLSHLGEQFAPEIQKLKATAIGATVAFLRDLVTPSLPPSVSGRVREVMDGVASKLGGTPVPEPIISSQTAPPHPERRAS